MPSVALLPASAVQVATAADERDPSAIVLSPAQVRVVRRTAPADRDVRRIRIPDDAPLVVATLLAKHAEKVAATREAVASHPHFDGARHDGLWLLRYLLSHKLKVKPAAAAARHSLQLRFDMKLDAIATVVRTTFCSAWPHFEALDAAGGVYCLPVRSPDESAAEAAAWHALDEAVARGQTSAAAYAAAQAAFAAHGDGGGGGDAWAWYLRGHVELCLLPDMDMHALYAMRDRLDEFMRYDQEWTFQCLDLATRRTGRIVKTSRVYSCEGVGWGSISLKLLRHDAEQQNASQDLYPQLLAHQYVCNLPRAINWFYANVLSPLLPARVRAKTGIVDTSSPAGRAALERHLRPSALPTWLGGESTLGWPPSWHWMDAAMPPIGMRPFRRYDEPGFVYEPPPEGEATPGAAGGGAHRRDR